MRHSEVFHESLSEVGEERQLMSIFQLNPVGENVEFVKLYSNCQKLAHIDGTIWAKWCSSEAVPYLILASTGVRPKVLISEFATSCISMLVDPLKVG